MALMTTRNALFIEALIADLEARAIGESGEARDRLAKAAAYYRARQPSGPGKRA